MKSRLLRSSMALAVLAMPAGLAIPVPLVAQHPKGPSHPIASRII